LLSTSLLGDLCTTPGKRDISLVKEKVHYNDLSNLRLSKMIYNKDILLYQRRSLYKIDHIHLFAGTLVK